MLRDPTKIPHKRRAPYRSSESVSADGDKLDATLKLENMLLEEFNYANLTAYQAMEDRTRMLNFYLVLVGILATGLGALYQFNGGQSTNSLQLIVALLLITGTAGIAFFIKLIRLRQAWRESVICMNVIKEFYIQQFRQQIPQIETAFRWRLESIPAGERLGSTTFVVCSTVALLESACFAGAAFVGAMSFPLFPPAFPYIITPLIFLLVLISNVLYYLYSLNAHSERKAIEQESEKIESVSINDTIAK